MCVTVDGGEGVELFSNIYCHFASALYICIYAFIHAHVRTYSSRSRYGRAVDPLESIADSLDTMPWSLNCNKRKTCYSQSMKRGQTRNDDGRFSLHFENPRVIDAKFPQDQFQAASYRCENSRKESKDLRLSVDASTSRFLVFSSSRPSLSRFERQCNIKQRKGARVRES